MTRPGREVQGKSWPWAGPAEPPAEACGVPAYAPSRGPSGLLEGSWREARSGKLKSTTALRARRAEPLWPAAKVGVRLPGRVLGRMCAVLLEALWGGRLLPGHGCPQPPVSRVRGHVRARPWDGSPGVEPFAHFRDRVCQAFEELLSRHHQVERFEEGRQPLWRAPSEGPRLLIVAHEGTNAVLLAHLLGIDPVPWEWLRFSSSWAGITKLKSWHFPEGAIFTLDYFNRTHHLAELEAGGGRKP